MPLAHLCRESCVIESVLIILQHGVDGGLGYLAVIIPPTYTLFLWMLQVLCTPMLVPWLVASVVVVLHPPGCVDGLAGP